MEVQSTMKKVYSSCLVKNNQCHKVCTAANRSSTLKYGIKSLRFRGAMLWNTLSDNNRIQSPSQL